MTTRDAVIHISKKLNIKPDLIGTAGLKDKDAITTQWISLPVDEINNINPEKIGDNRLEIIEWGRHGNKLKTGHLIGNKFKIRVRFCKEKAMSIASKVITRIMEKGMVNFYGEQRFGVEGSNVSEGRELILGKKSKNRFLRRLFMSSYQSHLFNGYAYSRLKAGLAWNVIEGDVLKKVQTGGIFVSKDIELDQIRFDNHEIVPTGPMIGCKMKNPEGESFAFEKSILEGMSYDDKVAEGCKKQKISGTRRPLIVYPWDMNYYEDDAGIVINFSLPKGSFATILIREIIKPDQDFGDLEFSDLDLNI
jgi:tRNA pseudouridine13 synthase